MSWRGCAIHVNGGGRAGERVLRRAGRPISARLVAVDNSRWFAVVERKRI